MNKKVIGVVDGQVVDTQQEQTGVASNFELVSDEVIDTKISNYTGILVVEDLTNGDGARALAHVANNAQVVSELTGSDDFNGSKDNANTINVYVESGTVKIQNKRTTAVTIGTRLV